MPKVSSKEPAVDEMEAKPDLKDIGLMLLFTRGVSLEVWNTVGMFEREIELYRRLLPELAEIRLLTYGNATDAQYEERLGGIKILTNKREIGPTKFSLLAPLILRKEFRASHVVKTNQLDGAWTGVIAKALFGKKLIVRCGYLRSVFQRNRLGNSFETRLAHFLEGICFRFADACVVAASADAEYIISRHRIPAHKVHVVPNYVNTDVFKRIPEIQKEPGLICFVGRLAPQKNIGVLFEACRSLKNIRLVVVGDGELRDDLQKQARDLGLNVEFLRSVPNHELPRLFNRAEMFVLPSLYEGCPKAMLEAMACELPVVGTNVSGIRDIIRDGENGILCENSPEAVRDGINRVFGDRASSERIARNARKHIFETCSLDRVVRMELDIIRKLTGDRERTRN